MIVGIIVGIVAVAVIAGFVFVNQPSFGRAPQGERLERIKKSPHYKDGEFRNLHSTVMMTSQKGRLGAFWGFLFKKETDLRPETEIPVIKTDLSKISKDENVLVWFGHSSYFIQVDGKRILVDPVFCVASPVSFVNKPFKGADAYKPADMPEIDYLVISHDHWDHLDYETVMQLKNRVGKVVCPLGVGEHFEYWGFDKSSLVELDWFEDTVFAAIESRTSSPVRIIREDDFQSVFKGVYPCGEGAGYAGGITSAAIDGIKVFESIISEFRP